MADNRDMTLEDAIELVVRRRNGGAERALMTPEETMLVAIAKELIEQRPKTPGVLGEELDRLRAERRTYNATVLVLRGKLRRHEIALGWALGEGDSTFAEDEDAAGLGAPRAKYWWRSKLVRIARGGA